MENMAMPERKHTETTSEDQKKALVCVVHFHGSAGESFVYFSDCQGPENKLEKLQDICKQGHMEPADSPYHMEDSCNQDLRN